MSCHQVNTRLNPQQIQKLTGTPHVITIIPTHMQLDDFLELKRANWTRLVIVIVSSYGIGHAPLGAYRFRELCEAWLERTSDDRNTLDLEGLNFALCGLGDSKFSTFFVNPTRIDVAMHHVGAKRVGPLGKADASGIGNDAQHLVIERWMDGIWPFLAQVVAMEPLPNEVMENMQRKTADLCRQINPDFPSEPISSQGTPWIPVLVTLLALAGGYYMRQNT
jgi:sulfite reductase alpha subunit-like flavoprotein